MGKENGRVSAELGEGLYTRITASGHTLAVDEPTEVGGTDKGPDPYAYLLSSLGSCTAMTLRMYADRKGWPLESVKVNLQHDRMYAEDCANCETETGKVDRIEREIELKGDLSAEQREKLIEIADKCPVHRTLTSETVVETRTPARA